MISRLLPPQYVAEIAFKDGRPSLKGYGATKEAAMEDLLLRHDPNTRL